MPSDKKKNPDASDKPRAKKKYEAPDLVKQGVLSIVEGD